MELVGRDFAFLEHVALEEGPVDVFPLEAQLVGQVLVERGCPLVVHLVKSERGL